MGTFLKTLSETSTYKRKQLWIVFDKILPSPGGNSYAWPRDIKSSGYIYSTVPGKAGGMADDATRVSQLFRPFPRHQFRSGYFEHAKDYFDDLVEGMYLCWHMAYRNVEESA